MIGQKEILINSEEHSSSAKILEKAVRVFKPKRYETYSLYARIIRSVDNLVDEGEIFQEAERVLEGQRKTLNSLWNGEPIFCQTEFDQALAELTDKIPSHLKQSFLQKYGTLLECFKLDLSHRLNLISYGKTELDEHIDGGFTSYFAGLKIILNDQNLSGKMPYLHLTRIHGEAEPLRDISEDLEYGLILHARENGAEWIEKLQVNAEVPNQAIDAYVVRRRGGLAKRMFCLAPEAVKEFGGVIGLLMTLDYYKRSFCIARWRFIPKEPVIFAKKRYS